MESNPLYFVLAVDPKTGLVMSMREIPEDVPGGPNLKGSWISVAPASGSATTLVFSAKKQDDGRYPSDIIKGD